jgi:ParB family transcriptional regulator, chromosome partitioning protein
MSQSPKPRGLGRGLAALLGDEDIAATVSQPATTSPPDPQAASASQKDALRAAGPRGPVTTLPITALRPGKYQPRTNFEDIDYLVDSIRQFGLLQPILVRPLDGLPGEYEIIAGERRWQAAQRVPLHEVPVVVRPLDDFDALQLALVENLQRTDLSAIEEARGYRRLMDDFNQTQETVAKTMGRSRPHIANTLRLLDLPPDVQDMLGDRTLTAGVARSLLAFGDPLAMARRAVAEGLTVRDLERLAANEKKSRQTDTKAGATAARPAGKSGDTKALEKRIEEVIGLRADLQQTGKGEQCRLTLEIADFDQLDTVVERLTRR